MIPRPGSGAAGRAGSDCACSEEEIQPTAPPNWKRMGALILNAEDRSVSVDLSKLGSPLKTYDADLASLEHSGSSVRLFFGKLRLPKRGSLATRVEIRYPIEFFYKHLWQNSREFHGRLRERAAALRISESPAQRQLHELEAGQRPLRVGELRLHGLLRDRGGYRLFPLAAHGFRAFRENGGDGERRLGADPPCFSWVSTSFWGSWRAAPTPRRRSRSTCLTMQRELRR